MSKIKDYLAEVADIDDLKAVDDRPNILDAISEAHAGAEVERETIINKLEMLAQDTPYQAYKDVLNEAVKYIKEATLVW